MCDYFVRSYVNVNFSDFDFVKIAKEILYVINIFLSFLKKFKVQGEQLKMYFSSFIFENIINQFKKII